MRYKRTYILLTTGLILGLPLVAQAQGARPFDPQAFVLKSGDTMTGTLTLSPNSGNALEVKADVNLANGNILKSGTLFIHSNGAFNTALGESALSNNTTGSSNTAIGTDALRYNNGSSNTASGAYALFSNYDGFRNTASGFAALQSNSSGFANTATGAFTLVDNYTGSGNTTTGEGSMQHNTTGSQNTATGGAALGNNTTGFYNTAVGASALLYNSTGSYNIAVGGLAGSQLGQYVAVPKTSMSNNIFIGNVGVETDQQDTIRIGGTQTRAFMAGISGTAVSGSTVLVSSSGQLGTPPSSRRFKKEIVDMGEASEKLLELRPVTFKYKQKPAKGEQPLQFGLIAEEVAEVLPELVVYDEEGQPYTVRYHLLSSMLLNELQKQERVNQEQEVELRLLRELDAELREVKAVLARLEAVEAKRDAPGGGRQPPPVDRSGAP